MRPRRRAPEPARRPAGTRRRSTARRAGGGIHVLKTREAPIFYSSGTWPARVGSGFDYTCFGSPWLSPGGCVAKFGTGPGPRRTAKRASMQGIRQASAAAKTRRRMRESYAFLVNPRAWFPSKAVHSLLAHGRVPLRRCRPFCAVSQDRSHSETPTNPHLTCRCPRSPRCPRRFSRQTIAAPLAASLAVSRRRRRFPSPPAGCRGAP